MPVKISGLGLIAAVSIVITLTACSAGSSTPAGNPGASASGGAVASASPAASTASTTAAAAIPAGFRRIGSATQGVSVAIPASWVTINPAEKSLESALEKMGLPGASSANVVQEVQSLQTLHAAFAIDVASTVSDPAHFARNINAYCAASSVNDTGSAGIPFLKQAAKDELSTIASDVKQQNVTVGGVPGIETSYQLDTKTTEKIDGAQLEVLPKPDTACFVTLSTSSSESQGNILAVAAATAQFP